MNTDTRTDGFKLCTVFRVCVFLCSASCASSCWGLGIQKGDLLEAIICASLEASDLEVNMAHACTYQRSRDAADSACHQRLMREIGQLSAEPSLRVPIYVYI